VKARPFLLNVEWDDVLQRLLLPLDYLLLSPWERDLISVGQLRPHLPREFKGLPDWTILRMTQFPGFAAMTDTTATGSGARTRTVVIKTSGSSYTVPGDWQDSFNTIECIGGGGSGVSGANGSDSNGGAGGGGGGGGGGAGLHATNDYDGGNGGASATGKAGLIVITNNYDV
jgi:hypothetical protein